MKEWIENSINSLKEDELFKSHILTVSEQTGYSKEIVEDLILFIVEKTIMFLWYFNKRNPKKERLRINFIYFILEINRKSLIKI